MAGTRTVTDQNRGRLLRRREARTALYLIAPFTLFFLFLFVYPSARVIQLSFTNATLTGGGEFIGFGNYRRLLSDKLFWKSFWNTGYFVLLTVVPNSAIGLVLALMVVRLKRLRPFVLSAFFLPYILPVSVVTLMWNWIFNANFGILKQAVGTNLALLNDPTWAMPTVALVTIWWTSGFNMLLFIAALQNIPREYYEAASLDGATTLGTFRAITWPLLWPVTVLVLTLQLISQLKIFAQVYLMTGGGPFNSTIVVLQYMYRQAFQQFNSGYAATIAMILFLVIMVLSVAQFTLLNLRSRR